MNSASTICGKYTDTCDGNDKVADQGNHAHNEEGKTVVKSVSGNF